MAARGKRPYHAAKSSDWAWFNADAIGPGLGDPESDIPEAVFERLTAEQVANHRKYPTVRAACEDFVAAWAAARRGGWEAGRAGE